MESFLTKEGVILVGNTMLVVMMALTLLGTIFPLITELIATQGITVTQQFYNRAVLPFSLLLLAMMGIGPLLGYGTSKLQELRRRLIWPAIAAIGTVTVLVVLGIHSGWAIACGIVISLTLAGILADVLATVIRGQRNILVLIDSNHRRYGGYLAHIGVAMIVAGVAGSSLYSTKTTLQLHPGESAHAGRYHVQLDSLTEVDRDNHTALQAALTATSDSGARYTLHPEVRKYAKSEQANAEVAIRMSLTEDLYLMLMGVQADTHAHAQADTDIIASVQVITNPLVSWIWFGGIAMTLGGIWCLLPSLRRAKLPVAQIADAKAASPTPSLQPR